MPGLPEPEEGIRIEIDPDGTVRIHAQCQPGQTPEECQERIRFLIEALGVPAEGVETEITPADEAPGGS